MTEDAFWAAIEAHAPRWRAMLARSAPDAAADLLSDLQLRVWRAFAAGKLASPGAAVRYAEAALGSVIIDHGRRRQQRTAARSVSLDAPTNDGETAYRDLFADAAPSPEDLAAMDDERRAVWELALSATTCEAERVAVVAQAAGYSAEETAARWPALFADVHDVYNARRNVVGRARRGGAAPVKAAIAAARAGEAGRWWTLREIATHHGYSLKRVQEWPAQGWGAALPRRRGARGRIEVWCATPPPPPPDGRPAHNRAAGATGRAAVVAAVLAAGGPPGQGRQPGIGFWPRIAQHLAIPAETARSRWLAAVALGEVPAPRAAAAD